MLLQFAVENFACFADEALFSMVASVDDEHPGHLVQSEAGRKPRILRTAALYGANGHGKTKLVEAMRLAQRFILKGVRSGQAIPVSPFRLNAESAASPTRFEFVIEYQGVEYVYGFLADDRRVHEEWLFGRPNVREVRYFERVTDAAGKVKVETGPALSGRTKKQRQFLEFVAQGARANQLFLTEAVDRNVEALQPLYEWFDEVLTVISATGRYQPLEVRAYQEKEFLAFIADFLSRAGTGIEGLETVQEDLDYDQHLPKLPDDMREQIEADIASGRIVTLMNQGGSTFSLCSGGNGQPMLLRLRTRHGGRDGASATFDFEEESAGTQRLMEILPMLADVRTREKVYVIDELDRKLHPLLSRLFVSTYLEQCGEEERGQLVFTSHDDNLLDLDLLRRDEIWFLEKDRFGASRLYSLSDLRVRPDLKINKGYLAGRFGGIPKLRRLSGERPCGDEAHTGG